jgi:hypothetical protein
MQNPTLQIKRAAIVAMVGALLSVSAAWAADPAPAAPTSQAAPSKEMREKMAKLHEQMAACLRSDKSIDECRTEMMKECHETMGKEGCPMMGGGHKPMHGMKPHNPG